MNTNNENERTFRHQKTPSLRDMMLGKKTVKSLPENFFEKVLELEIKLKRGFNMHVLQELCAIEYYESIEDPKFKDFQVSLNMLLSQPEILRKMNNLNKTGKSNVVETSSSYSTKYKKEQVKKQMKMKVDYAAHTQNRDHQVQKILKEAEKTDTSEIIETIVNKDLTSQEENFKKRMDEKKRKTLISTSDITDHIETLKNKRMNFGGKAGNKSVIIEGKNNNENLNIMNEIEGEGDNILNLNLSFSNNIPISNINNDGDNLNDIANDETNPHNNFLHSLDNSFEEKIDKKKIDDIDGEISFDVPAVDLSGIQVDTHKIGKFKISKQQQIFNDLKSNMDTFLDEFNYFFFEDVFVNVVGEIQKILEEKHKKTLEISKSYNNQIKEYEFLITTDNEGSYVESLTASIEQLKEELQTELENVDDHYDQIIKENKNKFKGMTLKNNNGIQLIEEKFRLDMFNTISNIINPSRPTKILNEK